MQSSPSISITNQPGYRGTPCHSSHFAVISCQFFAHGHLFASRFQHKATRVWPSVRREFMLASALVPPCGDQAWDDVVPACDAFSSGFGVVQHEWNPRSYFRTSPSDLVRYWEMNIFTMCGTEYLVISG